MPRSMPRSMSRFTLPLIAAVLLVLATAGAALGKCPPGSTDEGCQGVVASLDITGPLQAGTSTAVGIWVHWGEAPLRVLGVDLIFARVGDGRVLHFQAQPTATEGRYVAEVELPAGGSWTIAAEVRGLNGSTFSMPLETLQVINLPGAAADATDSAPAPSAPFTIPTWGWAALGAALLAAVIGTALIGRRRTATA